MQLEATDLFSFMRNNVIFLAFKVESTCQYQYSLWII